MTKRDEGGLTKNQRIFVNEYLKDRHGARAYKAAYPSCKKSNSAWTSSCILLSKPKVKAAVDAGLEQMHREAKIEAVDIRRELARIGFSDIRNIFNEDGSLKMPHEWGDDVAAAVSSVEVVTRRPGGGPVEYVNKIKAWDKKGSLELLGKELAMFTDKVDHSGTVTVLGTGYPEDKK